MSSNTNQPNEQDSSPKLRPSFSEVFFVWLYFTFLIGSAFYLLALVFFPLDQSVPIDWQDIIFRGMLLILVPMVTIPIFLEMLPFQKINFSSQALKTTLIHKMFFICTSPLLLIGYLIINSILRQYPVLYNSDFRWYILDMIFWLFVLPWAIFTLFMYEMVFGKNFSQILRRLRLLQKKNRLISPDSSISKAKYQTKIPDNEKRSDNTHLSYQWGSFSFHIFYFSMIIGTLALPIYGYFLLGLFIFGGIDIFFFCLTLHFYKTILIKRGYALTKWTKFYQILFGSSDISENAMWLGVGSNFFNFAIFISFYNLVNGSIILTALFGLYFIVIILLFIVSVWNNQIKILYSNILGR